MTSRVKRLALAFVLVIAGCASAPPMGTEPAGSRTGASESAPRSMAVDPQVAARILALDPQNVSDDDVRKLLATGPTPRIVTLHGGVYPVHLLMDSFSRFLAGMGYPQDKLRHPGDGRRSHSPYESSAKIAGVIAWYYEREGLRPIMVGHSQGGLQVVKVLRELAGQPSATCMYGIL